jgi:DNA replication protein DnaC
VLANKTKRGLILRGPSGCGKTHLGCAILCQLLLEKIKAHRVTATGIAIYYFNEFRILPRCLKRSVLFIDDIGREITTKKDAIKKVFYDIIKSRVEHNLVTVVSTHLSVSSFKQLYGEDLSSLLVNELIAVPFPNIDLREL